MVTDYCYKDETTHMGRFGKIIYNQELEKRAEKSRIWEVNFAINFGPKGIEKKDKKKEKLSQMTDYNADLLLW